MARPLKALFVQYTDPGAYPPIERAAKILVDRGWQVHLVGIALQGDVSSLKVVRRKGLTVRLIANNRFSRGPLRYARFLMASLGAIFRLRPQLIYCSDLLAYPVGLLASLSLSGLVVLHEHDTPGLKGDVPRVFMDIRRMFARRAYLCVVPQPIRADRFSRDTGAKAVATALNCPSISELRQRCCSGSASELTLWHHGSLGPARLPLSLLIALSKLPPRVTLQFAGYETLSHKGFVAQYLDAAREYGVSDRVSYLGALPRQELYAAAARADVGVCLFANEFVEPMVGASNKPFDYLACGLPLLCNGTAEWRDFFGKAGVATTCDPDDPEDIARAIRFLLEHPREREAMARRGLQRLNRDWNYEAQFEKISVALRLPEIERA